MHGIVAYTFLNIYWKIHHFLSSINRDVHKRKLVPLILLHGVVRSIRGIKAFPRFITPPAITFRSRCGQAARLPVKTTCAGHSLNHRRSFRAALRTLGGRAGTTQHLVCQTSNRTDHCCREPGSPAPCSPRRTLSGSKVNIGWSRRHQLSSRSLCVSLSRDRRKKKPHRLSRYVDRKNYCQRTPASAAFARTPVRRPDIFCIVVTLICHRYKVSGSCFNCINLRAPVCSHWIGSDN